MSTADSRQGADAIFAHGAFLRGRVLGARSALPVGYACDGSYVAITRIPLRALRFQRRMHRSCALLGAMHPTLYRLTHDHRCPVPHSVRALDGVLAPCLLSAVAGGALKALPAWPIASPHFPRPLWDSLASSASSGLSPLGRCRRFGSLAPALPVHVVLGSPAGTANADGSSLPTTARPSSSVTHPAHDDVRGHAGSARRRDSLRRPPPPQGARMFRAQGT